MNNGFRLCAFADESKKSKIRHNYSLQTPAFFPRAAELLAGKFGSGSVPNVF